MTSSIRVRSRPASAASTPTAPEVFTRARYAWGLRLSTKTRPVPPLPARHSRRSLPCSPP
ncbi:hypothetical protein ACFQVA_39510 [Actinomadura keratinilytica]